MCGAWFLPGPGYLTPGFITIGAQTSRPACRGPSSCPSLPPPRVSKSAFLQEAILVEKVFCDGFGVEFWVGEWRHLRQRVWVPR